MKRWIACGAVWLSLVANTARGASAMTWVAGAGTDSGTCATITGVSHDQ
jgi:hypothetical protein